MAYNQKIVHRYNNYITKRIPYRRMLNRIKIIKLFKQLLSMAYRGKEKNILLVRINMINIT